MSISEWFHDPSLYNKIYLNRCLLLNLVIKNIRLPDPGLLAIT